MFMFSSTVRSRSLVSACGITPIILRAALGSLLTSCPRDARFARSDRDQRGHHANQRGFARAVRSQQPEDFAFRYAERNIVDRGEVSVLLDDVCQPRLRWARSDRRLAFRAAIMRTAVGVRGSRVRIGARSLALRGFRVFGGQSPSV